MNRLFLALTCALFVLSPLCAFAAAPANNNFSNRITLTGTNITTTGSNVGANKESGEPNHAGNIGGKSIWWSWTAPTNGEVVISTAGSTNINGAVDTLLGVYTGSSVSALSLVASNDDAAPGFVFTSKVRFETIKGTNYQIAVDGYNDGMAGSVADSGSIVLTIVFIPEPILRPPNDNFTNRIVLTGASVITNGSNIEATREPGEPLHADRLGDTSVWWSWTAPAKTNVVISTIGSSFDTLLAVYTGNSVTDLVLVANNDDIDSANAVLTSTLDFDAVAGQRYEIAVDGFAGASGPIALRITPSAPPRLDSATLLPDRTFRFRVTGLPGRMYEADASAVGLGGWTPLDTQLNTNGSILFTDLLATNFNKRFYRAVLMP
jgi:hypothetical protein